MRMLLRTDRGIGISKGRFMTACKLFGVLDRPYIISYPDLGNIFGNAGPIRGHLLADSKRGKDMLLFTAFVQALTCLGGMLCAETGSDPLRSFCGSFLPTQDHLNTICPLAQLQHPHCETSCLDFLRRPILRRLFHIFVVLGNSGKSSLLGLDHERCITTADCTLAMPTSVSRRVPVIPFHFL
jgi:hypothetical protein